MEHARAQGRRRPSDGPPRRPRAARYAAPLLPLPFSLSANHSFGVQDISQVGFRWGRTLPLFAVLVAASSFAIFNYQKSSSPVIASTLYALRTHPKARAVLGDEIYFKHQIPWISGEMNQMQGRIDIHFPVRGSRATAVMRFTSRRPNSRSLFETSEWSLRTEDGTWIDLLEEGDPFKSLLAADDALPPLDEEQAQRGFRQQGALNK